MADVVDAAHVRAIDKGSKTHTVRYVDLQEQALAALKRQKGHTFMAGEFVFHNPYGRGASTTPARPSSWSSGRP